MAPIETIQIPLSKTKLLLLTLLCLVFVAMCCWMLIKAPSETGTDQLMLYAAGGVGAVLFGGFLVATLRKLFDERIGLIIDAEGLVDHSSGIAVGRIPWSDIADLEVRQVQRQRFVTVLLHNPEEYIARSSGLKKTVAKANTRFYGSPVHIQSNTLKIPFDQLDQRLTAAFESYQLSSE